MQLYILDESYAVIGMIDTYDSVLWIPKYNDVGECEIYVPCENDYLALLKKGHYIYRYDDDMFCKIECIEIETDVENGDHLICTALDIAQILSGRVIQSQAVFSGKVVKFIEKLLNDNVINAFEASRLIPRLRIDTTNFGEFTDMIETSAFGEDLLKRIITTCKTYNYGFRVRYDMNDGYLVFHLYKGQNKASTDGEEYVEFSPQFANILSSNYKEDDRNHKNVACVLYKDVAEQIKVMWVYVGEEPRFEKRREVSVDATGVSKNITYAELVEMFPKVKKNTAQKIYYIETGGKTIAVASYEVRNENEETITITDYTVEKLARNIGVDALAQARQVREYTGSVDTIDTYVYKVDYNIGDTVRVVNEYGIETEAQVTEVLESDDNDDGYVVEPKFEYLN